MKEIKQISLKVKEVTEKSGAKGPFWSIKTEEGKTFNAMQSDYLVVHAGQDITAGYTESQFEGKDKKTITSRWLVKPSDKDLVQSAVKTFGGKVSNTSSGSTTAIAVKDNTIAAILCTCFRFDTVEDCVKCYKDICAKI